MWVNGITNEKHLAPEIFRNESFNAQQTDLFAVGIFLFCLRSTHSPFNHAKPCDPFYGLIIRN